MVIRLSIILQIELYLILAIRTNEINEPQVQVPLLLKLPPIMWAIDTPRTVPPSRSCVMRTRITASWPFSMFRTWMGSTNGGTPVNPGLRDTTSVTGPISVDDRDEVPMEKGTPAPFNSTTTLSGRRFRAFEALTARRDRRAVSQDCNDYILLKMLIIYDIKTTGLIYTKWTINADVRHF